MGAGVTETVGVHCSLEPLILAPSKYDGGSSVMEVFCSSPVLLSAMTGFSDMVVSSCDDSWGAVGRLRRGLHKA